jgi:SsrA-binding protein
MSVLVSNKKVLLNYEILEKFEVGIELLGFEVKSLKQKLGSLAGSYVIVRGAEAYLIAAHIPPYQAGNTPKDYDSYRNRKLLLTRKEITELIGIEKQKGLTIVPVSVYNKGRKVKVEIAIARGKKKYDKRQTLKKKDALRDIQRTLKG